jgi:anti-anti-sigma regulatory factor
MYESSAMGLEAGDAAVLELSGEILGDSVSALDQLQQECADAEAVVISCRRLIRVDFIAAGNILNWVAERQANGVHVQFSDVPPLVAAFFSVIGIDEHAAVVLRMR